MLLAGLDKGVAEAAGAGVLLAGLDSGVAATAGADPCVGARPAFAPSFCGAGPQAAAKTSTVNANTVRDRTHIFVMNVSFLSLC